MELIDNKEVLIFIDRLLQKCNYYHEEKMRFGDHFGLAKATPDGFHFYFEDTRIPREYFYYALKYKLIHNRLERSLDEMPDEPICSTVRRVYFNEPVHMFAKLEKYEVTIPEKQVATKTWIGFRSALVLEYTKEKEHKEDRIDYLQSQRNIEQALVSFQKAVNAKIERNDKFIKNLKLTGFPNQLCK